MAFEFPAFRDEYMPNEHDFKRMCAYNKAYIAMKYEDFINWNRMCFNLLLNPEFAWLQSLCKLVKANKISLIDMEHCGEFNACYIYFDKNKNITIGAAR